MRLVLFGPGYVGSRVDAFVRFGRHADPADVRAALAAATHVVSTVAPDAEGDPILRAYAAHLTGRWLGYLSSTGVYGDTGGAWVDEGAPLLGRRGPRIAADEEWQRLGAGVLRLPGIYGPGRSILDRISDGAAHRIDLPGQVFSRVHLDDIVAALRLAAEQEATGVFNIADDLPAPQNALVEAGCALLSAPLPPLQSIAQANLSPAARAFYAENRRVANGKAKRVLGWRPRYPDYRAGLRALTATTSPASASATPAAAVSVQR
jgi:nucleoside-diphosphate-sugar epimerase